MVRLAPGGGKQTMSFTLSLGDERRSSRLKVSSDGTFYRINVRHEKQKGSTAVVHLELRCDEHRTAGRRRYWRTSHRAGKGARRGRRRTHSSTEVSLSSRLTLGRRALLGKLKPTGGGEMRIAVTLR